MKTTTISMNEISLGSCTNIAAMLSSFAKGCSTKHQETKGAYASFLKNSNGNAARIGAPRPKHGRGA